LWRLSFSSAWRAGRLALALLLVASAPARGGIGTSSFTAQASVNTQCTISTTAVVFGAYDPIGTHRTANLDSVGSVNITCVKGTTPTIALGPGMHASGSTRRMRDAANTDYLVYELYKPSSNAAGAACAFPGATVWGTSGAGLFTAAAAPSRTARAYNVCGTVPAGQNPMIGTYSDTVVATVSF